MIETNAIIYEANIFMFSIEKLPGVVVSFVVVLEDESTNDVD